MLDREAIYQRTDLGRNEIRSKSHGLTQSERLILILVDGVGELGTIKTRLQGVTDERFDRAVRKLLASHIVEQVLLQVSAPIAEEIEDDVANRFLRQDPLDPVTIISFEPEEEFPIQEADESNLPAMPADSAVATAVASTPPVYRAATKKVSATPTAVRHAPVRSMPARTSAPSSIGHHVAASFSATSHAAPGVPHNGTASGDSFTWQYWVGLLVLSVLTSVAILVW